MSYFEKDSNNIPEVVKQNQINYAWADFYKKQRDYYDKKAEKHLRKLDDNYRQALLKQHKDKASELKQEILNHLESMREGVVCAHFNRWVDSQIKITNHRVEYYNFLRNNPNYRG